MSSSVFVVRSAFCCLCYQLILLGSWRRKSSRDLKVQTLAKWRTQTIFTTFTSKDTRMSGRFHFCPFFTVQKGLPSFTEYIHSIKYVRSYMSYMSVYFQFQYTVCWYCGVHAAGQWLFTRRTRTHAEWAVWQVWSNCKGNNVMFRVYI